MSFGVLSPAGNGWVAVIATVQVEVGLGIWNIGVVQRSTLSSPHVKTLGLVAACTAGSWLIVTHTAKSMNPLSSLSNIAHASPVLAPEKPVVSQFQVTARLVGRLVASTPWRVRSFWPGSSFAPFSSTVNVKAAWAGALLRVSAPNSAISATSRSVRACRSGVAALQQLSSRVPAPPCPPPYGQTPCQGLVRANLLGADAQSQP